MTSKPIHAVTDYSTHRQAMRKTINGALPHRNPVLGLMIGLAYTIALVWAATSFALTFFAG